MKTEPDCRIESSFCIWMQTTQEMVYEKDCSMRYMHASDAYAKFLGYPSSEDLIGKSDMEIFSDSAAALRNHMEDQNICAGKLSQQVRHDVWQPQVQTSFSVTLTKTPVFKKDGQINGLFAMIQAVPCSKQPEQKPESDSLYLQLRKEMQQMHSDAFGAVWLNLTQNKCLDIHTDYSRTGIRPWNADDTAEGFFQSFASRLEDERLKIECLQVLNRTSLLEKFLSAKDTVQYDRRYPLKPGKLDWVRTTVRMTCNPDTGDVEALVYSRSIDEKNIGQRILDQFIQVDYEFIAVVDRGNEQVTFLSPTRPDAALPQEMAYADALNQFALESMDESTRAHASVEMALSTLIEKLQQQNVYACTYSIQENGSLHRKKWQFSFMGESHEMIAFVRSDVTDSYLTEHDSLTGLYNRKTFTSYVQKLLPGQQANALVMICLDIDNFKIINDRFGHEEGDRLLVEIGKFLEKQNGLIGGLLCHDVADRFYILCQNRKDMLKVICDRSIDALRIYDLPMLVNLRFGLYSIEDPALDVNNMIDRAAMAARSIKGSATTNIAYYDAEMREKILREQELINEMHSALKKEQFVLYFQPQYDYGTKAVIGVEALVRWAHPTKGLIPPGRFIPLFERNGFITVLDKYVWEKSCAYMHKWVNQYGKAVPLSVSINISRLNLYDPDLCNTLIALTEKYQLDRSMLRLEITESLFMSNTDSLVQVVSRLRKDGFFVELDDFGSGFSSLNTLKDVPVDLIKLDMKFLSAQEANGRSGIILNSIVRMAHWLKIQVMAEGVETEREAEYLHSIGCGLMQGYYLARPMPAAEFESMLKDIQIGSYTSISRFDHCFNNEEFFDPDAQATAVFNSFVGAAGIFEYHDGKLLGLRLNEKFCRIVHMPAEDAQRNLEYALSNVAPEDEKRFRVLLDSVAESSEEHEYEGKWLDMHDPKKYAWLHIRMIRIAKNKDRCVFYASVEDITKQCELEEQLRAYSESLRQAVAQIGATICRYEVATQILTVPQLYARLHGIPEQIQVPDDIHIIAGESRKDYINFFTRIQNGEREGDCSIQLHLADGSLRWEHASFVTSFDVYGQPEQAILTITDITARREREVESERINLLVARTGLAMFDYDTESDLMHFTSVRSGRGVTRSDIPNYMQFIENAALVQPDSAQKLRELIHEAKKAPSTGTIEFCADNWGNGLEWSRAYYTSIADHAGKIFRIIGQVDNIQEEKGKEFFVEALSSRLNLSSGARTDDPIVTEKVFDYLHAADNLDIAMNRVLETLGKYYEISRAYIFEDSPDHLFASNTYEWCAPNVNSQKEQLQNISYAETFGGHYRKNFNADGVFLCPDVDSLPEPQRAFMAQQGIHAMLQCEILHNGEYIGFLGFDDCSAVRDWTTRQISTLANVSKLIGHFLLKKKNQLMASFSDDLADAIDCNATMICVIDPETDEILYMNQALKRFTQFSSARKCFEAVAQRTTACVDCPLNQLKEDSPEPSEIQLGNGTYLLAHASPLRWHGRKLAIVTSTDISERKKAEKKLHILLEEYKIVIKQSEKIVIMYDMATRTTRRYLLSGNYQVAATAENVPDSMVQDGTVAPECVSSYMDFYRSMFQAYPTGEANVRMRIAPSVEYRWFHMDYTLIYNPDGTPSHSVISMYENTEQMKKEFAYRTWQEEISERISSCAVYLEVNLSQNHVEQMLGLTKAAWEMENGSVYSASLNEFCRKIVYPDDAAMLAETMGSSRLAGLYHAGINRDSLDFRTYVQQSPHWYRAEMHLICHPLSNDLMMSVTIQDIDQARKEQDRLATAAIKDSVTGILNRNATQEEIIRHLQKLKKGVYVALFMVDMDNFKQINDTYGHQQGDHALYSAAQAIRSVFRSSDIVGRLGGDEFMVYLEQVTPELVKKKASRLLEVLQFSVDRISVSASIGVVIANNENIDYDTLYRLSDQAMYRAKRSGKNQFSILSTDRVSTASEIPVEDYETIPLQPLLRYMAGGIVVIETAPTLRLCYVSPSLCSAFNKPSEGADIYAELLRQIRPDELETLRHQIRKADRRDDTFTCIFHISSNGQPCRICFRRFPAADAANPRFIGVVSVG